MQLLSGHIEFKKVINYDCLTVLYYDPKPRLTL